jgi:hypothetical protein
MQKTYSKLSISLINYLKDKLTKKSLLFTFLFASIFLLITPHQSHAQHKWNGLSLRMQGGLYADYLTMKFENGTSAPPTGVGNIFGWGAEYSFLIKEHFYIGLDLGFGYYDRLYKAETKEDISRFAFPILADFPEFARYLVPITYVHLGYATKDWVLTIGPAYIQGIVTTARLAITDHVSVDFRHTWFLDRFINVGIHDMHFLFSMTYTF